MRLLILILVLMPQCLRPPRAAPALPLSLAFEERFDPSLENQMHSIVQAALTVVAVFPPTNLENHIFDWKADRSILTGKSLNISIATSRSQFLQRLRVGPGGIPKDLDAVTIAPMDLRARRMPIFVVLLADKLFYEFGREREDAFARAIIALAHELYGNVQRYLLMDFKDIKPMTFEMRAQGEVEAFTASVRFLEDLMRHPKFSELPESIRKKVTQQLPREKEGLASWERALKSCRSSLN